MNRRTLLGLAQNVAIPILSYLLLVLIGWEEVWALTGSAAVSALILGIQWIRTRKVNALGALVLIRFLLAVLLAAVTGDARIILVKDAAVSAAIAAVAAATLFSRRTLIERIRRDLSGDPAEFDREVRTEPAYRHLHRRLTILWVTGILTEAAVSAIIALTFPVTPAVIITNITGPAVIISLVAYTQWRANHLDKTTTRL